MKRPIMADKTIKRILTKRPIKSDSRTDAQRLADRVTAQAMRDSAHSLTQQAIDRLGKG